MKSYATKFHKILITIYVLVVLGFSATVRAENNNLPVFQKNLVKSQVYTGEVAMTVDGDFYLIMNNESYFMLVSKEDLSSFNGKVVQVVGFELKYTVGPVFELQSTDPLHEDEQEEKPEPVLYVLKVNTI